jgi:hypothetical protein
MCVWTCGVRSCTCRQLLSLRMHVQWCCGGWLTAVLVHACKHSHLTGCCLLLLASPPPQQHTGMLTTLSAANSRGHTCRNSSGVRQASLEIFFSCAHLCRLVILVHG